MAYNPIQFQQGMSLPEFLQCFGTEAVCAEAVRRARWPDGFVCPRCKGSAHCVIVSGSRRLFQCHACHRQTSLTAGTLFGSTKLSLTRWLTLQDGNVSLQSSDCFVVRVSHELCCALSAKARRVLTNPTLRLAFGLKRPGKDRAA